MLIVILINTVQGKSLPVDLTPIMFYSQETSRNNYGNSLVNVSILSRL